MTPAEPSPDRLLSLSQGYLASAILRTALELGVFDQLAGGDSSAEDIAVAIEADPRATCVLLDGLTAIGLVSKAQDRFRLSELAQTFLVRGGARYMGDALSAYNNDVLWEALQRLPQAVRQGGTALETYAETPEHHYWGELAAAVVGAAAAPATALATLLEPWARARATLDILDVACGNGTYGYVLAKQEARARVWSLDWPNVLPIAEEQARVMGVVSRVHFIVGDMFDVPLGGPYDLVILSHVLHHFSEERCAVLLRRIAAALHSNGRLAIHDFISDPSDPAATPASSIFSVVLLGWTRDGRAHSTAAVDKMLAIAGFRQPTQHQVPHLPTRLLVADLAR